MSTSLEAHHERSVRSRAVRTAMGRASTTDGLGAKLNDIKLDSDRQSYSVPPRDRAQRPRIFPTIEYASRVSHFDPKSDYRDFKGFYVLFWVALTIMTITSIVRNIKDTGYPTRVEIWQLFTVKLGELALADALMILTTAISLPIHKAFRSSAGNRYRLLQWACGGVVIQSIYECVWFVFWVTVPFIQAWTWTAQVFLTLHTFVLLMKMHSYAFYNGHLSETELKLQAIDQKIAKSKESTSPDSGVANFQDSSIFDLLQLHDKLTMELNSPTGSVMYPKNLTWSNYLDYLLCPTLCYELEYPRTPEIAWIELGKKALAVFGVIFLLTTTSEEFIVPVLADSAKRLEHVTSFVEMALILAETISFLLFPFMITFLLVFLVIFEYILGAFAEITCFADRHFYSDWWNSTDWMEFSRKWNIPVHNFFQRHVYRASRPHIGRRMATFITFLISSLGHEIVMACITKKIRGYGFVLQMSQLPVVILQRTKWAREKKLLNNVQIRYSHTVYLYLEFQRV
ncbi:hypothetical protein K3495_g13958 [Podosphaera aphanis]|nr:hypothetical protein K3495_g13958 [Podosphaera aphanis]